ncbi:hypothetical protein C8R43DRAFT_966296 [Mycena crocata]|nr:hypothetical protein C8R43DRAFT_966296 [Mycena crocata]
MAGDDKKPVTFSPLDDTSGWGEWSIRMEVQLIRKKLVKVVWHEIEIEEGKEAEGEVKIAMWMMKRDKGEMAEGQLGGHAPLSESGNMFGALPHRHKFLTVTKGPTKRMAMWIDQILVLTMGLEKSYKAFVISLDATLPDDLTLEYVKGRMLNEEVHRNKHTIMAGEATLPVVKVKEFDNKAMAVALAAYQHLEEVPILASLLHLRAVQILNT